MDFIREQFPEMDRSEQMEKFYNMEKNPKIGPNNVHMIIDFYNTLGKLKTNTISGGIRAFHSDFA